MFGSGPKVELLLFGSACGLTAGSINGIQTAVPDLPQFPCLLPLCMVLRKGMNSAQEAEEVWLPFLLSHYCNPEMKRTSVLLNKIVQGLIHVPKTRDTKEFVCWYFLESRVAVHK